MVRIFIVVDVNTKQENITTPEPDPDNWPQNLSGGMTNKLIVWLML